MHPRPYLRCGVLALLAAAAAGQGSPKSFAWPAPYLGGAFARCELGDYTGDERISAVVLRGGAVYFAYHVAVHEAVSLVATGPVADVVALPAVGGARRNRILATGPGRPVVMELQADGTFSMVPVLTALWRNATGLTTAPDAAGGAFVAAIAEDGEMVRVAHLPPSGSLDEVVAVDAGGRVSEVRCLDFDHDGAVELVAMVDGVAQVYAMDGSPERTLQTTLTEPVTAVVRTPTGDRLACGGAIGGSPWLLVADATAVSPLVPLDTSGLGTTEPLLLTGLCAADLEGDGDDDLLLSHRSSHIALLLVNGGGVAGAAQLPLPIASPPPAGDPALNRCPGVLADADLDGAADALFCLDSSPSCHLSLGAGASQANAGPPLVEAAWYDGAVLQLRIPREHGEGFTHLQLIAWQQLDPTASPPPLQKDATAHLEWTLALLAVDPEGNWRLPVPLDPAGGSIAWPAKDHFYLELRFWSQTTEKASMVEVEGVTMQPALGAASYSTYLESLATPGSSTTLVQAFVASRPEIVGIILTRATPPPFGVGVIPNPGDKTSAN